MKNILFKLFVTFQELKNNESGQDLVEYALVVALIAFGSTAGMIWPLPSKASPASREYGLKHVLEFPGEAKCAIRLPLVGK